MYEIFMRSDVFGEETFSAETLADRIERESGIRVPAAGPVSW